MNKILFIGHDANRAGAQYLLLHLLTYLQQTGVETALLLTGDGPLRSDYERVTTVYEGFVRPTSASLSQRLLKRLNPGGQSSPAGELVALPVGLLDTLRAQKFTLIFANTIANGGILKALQPLDLPFVAYVHELETSIRIYTRPADLRYQLDQARHFFCGSAAVQANLVNQHGVSQDRTTVLNSLIRAEPLLATLAQVDRLAVRAKLGIPPKAIVVGGCGNAEWRKGVDLFALVAQQVLKQQADVYFIWVGMPKQGPDREHLTYDLDRMGIADHVHLIEPGGNYLDYVACFDLFTLTSREDPYPLVMLEAGLNHNPVLTFRGSGGSADYVGETTGCLITYSDVSAMATVILRLAQDEAQRAELGAVFYQRALAHDTAVLVPRLLVYLTDLLHQPTLAYGGR